MAAADLSKRWGLIVGLRALLMLLAGLYAVIWPVSALSVLVIAGGVVLLVDGVLGLWSLTFGGAKTGNFWFDVVRSVLAILTGLVILLSPFLATLITVWFVVYLVAFQAILVGVMEILVGIRERSHLPRIWPVLLSGALYVLFGVRDLLRDLRRTADDRVLDRAVHAGVAALSRGGDDALTGGFALERGVERRAEHEDLGGIVHPQEHNDRGRDRAEGRRVVAPVLHVDGKHRAGDDPQQRREDGARPDEAKLARMA
eukprot:gene1226-1650_t